MSGKPKTGDVRLKSDMWKRLGEKVSSVNDPGSMINKKKFGFNVRVNEMIVNVDVFSLAVIRVVDRKRLSTVVISANKKRRWTRKLELMERCLQPDPFLNCTCESDILSFCSGKSNTVLFLC